MLKKISVIFLTLAMLCTMLPSAFAENTFSGIIGSGEKASSGWEVYNADGADISNGTDAVYGTTAVLSTRSAQKNTAFGKKLSWGETDNVLQIDMAIRRSQIGGADVAAEGWGVDATGPLAEPNGTQFINFASDGFIYYYGKNQNGDNKILLGAYEANIWYEVSITYLPEKGRLAGTINGGRYQNQSFATGGFVAEKFTELDFGLRSTKSAAADVSFGYITFEVSDATVTQSDLFDCDFDDFEVGAFSGSGGALGQFDIPADDKPYIKIAESDASHGKSVLFTHEGAYVDQLQYKLAQPVLSGTLAVEYSICIGNNTGFELIVDGTGSDALSGASGYFFAMSMGSGEGATWLGSRFGSVPSDAVDFAWQYGKWYRIKILFNMTARKMTMQISSEGNTADMVRKERSISGFSGLTQLGFGVENKGGGTYLDHLKIYKCGAEAELLPEQVFLYHNSPFAWADNRRYAVSAPYIENETAFVSAGMTAAFLGAEILQNAESSLTFSYSGVSYTLTENAASYQKGTASLPLNQPIRKKDGVLYICGSDLALMLNTGFFSDRCGYIVLGSGASSYDLNRKGDKQTLDKAAQSVIYDSPAAEEVTALLKAKNPNNEHPRLLLRQSDIPKLREKTQADATISGWTSGFLNYVNRSSMKRALPTYVLSDVRLNVSREVKLTLGELAFAYILTGEAQYADAAIQVMLRVSDPNYFKDWNPYHFLDVADMAGGVALAYDWCYDRMTETEKAQVKNALVNYGLKEVIRDYTYDTTRRRTWAWSDPKSTAYPQNWVAVCCGGLNLAALAVGTEEDVSSLAGKVIAMGTEHMKDLLMVFGPDGAFFEGPGYWEYAYEYFALSMGSMETALGTSFRLTEGPGFKNGAYYIIGNAGATGTFNLNDCLESLYNSANSPEFMWLSNIADDAALTQYRIKFIQNGHASYTYKDILWYNPAYAQDNTKIAEDGMWRELNVASSRTGYEKTDLYAAIHGGEEGRDIGDLDYGTFVIDKFNKRWALDLGKDDANYDSNKVGKTRWEYYRSRGEGHNTIILNPDGGNDQDKDAICPITEFKHDDRAMFAVTDLTAAHSYRGAESVVRGMYVDKATETVTIQDEVKIQKPSELYWFMHTKANISIAEDGRTAVLSQGGYRMGVSLVGSSALKLTKMQATPLNTSPHPSDMADDSGIYKLVIHATGITDETFAVQIYPLTGSETAQTIAGSCTPISEWSLASDVIISDLALQKGASDGGKTAVTAYATAAVKDGTARSVTLIAAAYDQAGRLTDCSVSEQNIRGTNTVPLQASVHANSDGTVCLFTWERGKLHPYGSGLHKSVRELQ